MRFRAPIIAVLLLAASAAPARADGDLAVFEVSGDAPADAPDAKTRALDAAFAGAVARALAAEADAATLRAHRQRVDADILGRARRYIASFKTLATETRDGRVHVTIQAKVDRGRVRAALAEIGVSAERPKPRRPEILALVGAETDDPGAVSMMWRALEGQGIKRFGLPKLPADDAGAINLGRDAHVGAVLVVRIVAAREGRIRATSEHGARVTATVRLLEVDGGVVVISTEFTEAGHGADPAAAARDAVTALAVAVAQEVGEAAARRWPEPRAGSAAGVVVRVRGAVRWGSIEAIQTAAALPGTRAVVRRVSGGEVDIGIEGVATAERVAGALRTATLPLGSLRVDKVAGDRIEVAVDGDGEGND